MIDSQPSLETYEVTHAATRYVAVVARSHSHFYIMLETGWSGNHGQWIRLEQFDDMQIAWSYLEEKLPALDDAPGDKPGWVKLFASFGVEVFG
jgi:hypothetical protein